MINAKIKEVENQLKDLRSDPKYPVISKEHIKAVVGDAETYIEKLLVWLRKLKYENNLR